MTPDDDALRQVYAAHKPTRPRWPDLDVMLADPVLRHVLVALARHCPTPTAEAIKRAGIVAKPGVTWVPASHRTAPFLDQKSKAAGEREDDQDV